MIERGVVWLMNIRNEEGKMRMHFSLGGGRVEGGIMVFFCCW